MSRILPNLVLILWFAVLSSAQTTPLSFRPIDARYSNSLDRIIMVSAGPHQLHIYNPANQADTVVALSKAPISLSVGPSGLYAAVGHDQLISYVNLSTATVERTYTVPQNSTLQDIILAADYVYQLTNTSVRLSNGAITNSANYAPSNLHAVLHPSGQLIFGVNSSNYIQIYDISSGSLLTPINTSSFAGVCTQLWISPTGSRYYDACGNIHKLAADNRTETGSPTPLISANTQLLFAAESAATRRLGVIPRVNTNFYPQTPLADTEIKLFDTDSFVQLGAIALPTLESAGRTLNYHGRWIFFNNAGTVMYTLMQADTAASLLNDFALRSIALTPTPSCTASFAANTLAIPASGAIRTIAITSPGECTFQAASNTPWIQVLSGGFGAGNSTLTILVRGNSGSARSALITVGNQTLAVNQDAAPAITPSYQRLAYPNIAAADYSNGLDKLVFLTTSPNELHVYDPFTTADRVLPLPSMPVSISVRPDGLFAAIGHNWGVYYVNLSTLTIDGTYDTSATVSSIVLPSNGSIYGSTTNNNSFVQVNLSTAGVSTPGYTIGALRLHPSGIYLYGTSFPYMSKFDISQPQARLLSSNPPDSPNYCSSSVNTLWISQDGRRIFNTCARAFRSSESPAEDLQPAGQLFGLSGITAFADSSTLQTIAAVPTNSNYSDSEIQLFNRNDLTLTGRLALTRYSNGLSVYSTHGRFIFFNAAGNRVVAITQADTAAAANSPFAVEVFGAESFSGCPITLSPQIAALPGNSGSFTVQVTTPPNCLWEVRPNNPSPVTQFVSVPFSSSAYAGSGFFTFSVSENPTGISRTNTLLVGSSNYTVTQGALTGVSISPTAFTFGPSASSGSLSVSAPTGFPWNVTSNADWVTGSSIVRIGSQSVFFSVQTNPGSNPRTTTLNIGGQIVTITQAGVQASSGLRFVPVTPCRIADTRDANLPPGFGTPAIPARTTRDFPIPNGRCGIPSSAAAYSLNVTVVPRGSLGYLTIWPAGSPQPLVSTLNSFDGRIKANAAIVPAGANGAISIFAFDTTDVILDINGYFTSQISADTLTYFPLTPCRVLDTRLSSTAFIPASQTRTISFLTSCGVAITARAFVLNATAIPGGPLGYLSLWPAGSPQPLVSTLNSPTGSVVANTAIVAAGANQSINAFASNGTDLVIDVSGYFAPPLTLNPGHTFYPVRPCRAIDTRNATGPLGGPILAVSQSRSFNLASTACGIGPNAFAFAVNATVVPASTLGYLTLWAGSGSPPNASTLNSLDGAVVSNAAILPASTAGNLISAYATDPTHFILDISGYFAP